MNILSRFESDDCHLNLEGELTIYHAAEVKPEVIEALDRCEQMHIHLGSVSEIDTAGLQVLILAKQEALRAGKALHLTDHSTAVMELIDLFGLSSYFGDPVLIKSQRS